MVGKHTNKGLPVGSKNLQASVSKPSSSFASVSIVEDHSNLITFAVDNVDAMVKSNAIFCRSVRSLSFAWVGMVSITAEDGFASTKAVVSCRSIPDSISLQTELAKLNIARVLIRVCVLSRMALETAEEATCPLIRRMQVGVEQGVAKSAA